MLLSASLRSAARKAALPLSLETSISPKFRIHRRGLLATLICGPARKIAPMGRRSFQPTWKGYFRAYRSRTSAERSWTRAPAGPKRSEILNVLLAPGWMSRQLIMNGYLVLAGKFVEYGTFTEQSTSSLQKLSVPVPYSTGTIGTTN